MIFSSVLATSCQNIAHWLGMNMNLLPCTQHYPKTALKKRNENRYLIPIENQEDRMHLCVSKYGQSSRVRMVSSKGYSPQKEQCVLILVSLCYFTGSLLCIFVSSEILLTASHSVLDGFVEIVPKK